MRILFLSAWCPLPADNGSKLRITHLLRELSRQHQVDLLHSRPSRPATPRSVRCAICALASS